MNKLKSLIVSIVMTVSFVSFGQMGINTTRPDSSSVLELSSIRRGFLLPRMSSFQRRSVIQPANGLLVFDKEDKMFYFYDSTYATPNYGWTGLSPWIFKDDQSNKVGSVFMRDIYTHNSVRSIGIGTTTPNNKNALTVANNLAIGDATTEAPANGLFVKGDVAVEGTVGETDVTTFAGNGIIPIGGIILWSGTTEPAGWKLCVGGMSNGVKIPNLQGRFIVGAGTKKIITREQNGTLTEGPDHSYTVTTAGTVGGADHVKMKISELPKHQHEAGENGATMNIDSSGVHDHTVNDYRINESSSSGDYADGDGTGGHDVLRTTTDGEGKHIHSTSSFKGLTGVGKNVNNGAHENRPPYYVLAYLIRVK